MVTLNVSLGERSYPIYIGRDLIDQPDLFKRHITSQQVMVVSNEIVAPLYLDRVLKSLAGFDVVTVVLPDGEEFKTLNTVETVFNSLLENRFSRNSLLIALGGGVIGDLVGFAAACYQRGIAFIQVPTTLLAQVDSSVGGKTGVNHPLGKNMIGAFYQPKCVITDTRVLESLDARQMSAGLAEVIKYGLIRDTEFFTWLETNMDALIQRSPSALAYAIERSCSNKADIVAEDEMESGVRAILNLGHTFGHAIEAGLGYGSILHGEAVAIGICQASDLSRRMGFLNNDDVHRIEIILQNAELPTAPPEELSVSRYLEIMAVDKKNIDGRIRFILLERIGRAKLPCSVEIDWLEATLNEYGRN